MRRIRSSVTILLTALVAVGLMTPSGSAAADQPPDTTYYLALGDSLAFGTPSGVGYAEYLTDTLQESQPGLQLKKLGCPGESTETMINGAGPWPTPEQRTCAALYKQQYGGSTNQLDAALWFLHDNPGAVTYLTIDIGPNDVLRCIEGLSIDAGCVLGGLGTVRRNLPTIFGELRQHLDGATKTAGMTFYNPFAALWPLSQDVAKQSVIILNGLNIIEAANYWRFGFRIAPVAAAFQTNDFSIDPNTGLPANSTKACLWTFMCPPNSPDVHPNQLGYEAIADTFAQTFHVG